MYKDTLYVADDGRKPLNNFFVELEILINSVPNLQGDEFVLTMNDMENKVFESMRSSDLVLLFYAGDTTTIFVDKNGTKKHERTSSVSMGGDIPGVTLEQPKGEVEAMAVVKDALKKDGEEFTRLNPTENYTRSVLKKFGVVSGELYIEILVRVPQDEDNKILPKLSDEIAAKLKEDEKAVEYMEKQGANEIKILVKSSLYGDLEHKYPFEKQ